MHIICYKNDHSHFLQLPASLETPKLKTEKNMRNNLPLLKFDEVQLKHTDTVKLRPPFLE